MELTKDAIEKILELAPAQEQTFNDGDGKQFEYLITNTAQNVTLQMPPAPAVAGVVTLTGLVDMMEAGFDKFVAAETIVRVISETKVSLCSREFDDYARLRHFVAAETLETSKFQFGSFMSQEAFVISLASMFVQDDETAQLIGLAGNLAAQAEVKLQDNGITQSASTRNGVVMAAERVMKPRVTLKAFRTFLEAEQPPCDFIFRVKEGPQGPMCALFEADGGQWKLTAMQNVKTWLKNRLATSTVDGLGDIPIIC